MVGKGREREKIKIIDPFRSVPTRRVIENSNKIAKSLKKFKKIPLWPPFKPKQVGKGKE